PDLRFAVLVDGRQVLATTGSGVLRDAAARVLGAELAAQLLEIEALPGESAGGTRVRGLIGPPALSRATRAGITLLVNGRSVQPRRLAIAVEQAYGSLLPIGRHPLAIVEIAGPPAEVDVNVHPTKAEVRFRDERAVFATVLTALRGTLGAIAPVPDFTLFGRMAETDAPPPAGPVSLPGDAPPTAPLWQALLRPQEHDGAAHTAGAAPQETPRLPLLRVVGQTGSTYIVAEGPTGMYLIDQHAAHERVL